MTNKSLKIKTQIKHKQWDKAEGHTHTIHSALAVNGKRNIGIVKELKEKKKWAMSKSSSLYYFFGIICWTEFQPWQKMVINLKLVQFVTGNLVTTTWWEVKSYTEDCTVIVIISFGTVPQTQTAENNKFSIGQQTFGGWIPSPHQMPLNQWASQSITFSTKQEDLSLTKLNKVLNHSNRDHIKCDWIRHRSSYSIEAHPFSWLVNKMIVKRSKE